MPDVTNFPKAGDEGRQPAEQRARGDVKHDPAFTLLSRVVRQGGKPTTRAEEKAVRLREARAGRHHGDHQLSGVVAQTKWLTVGALGEQGMKDVMNAAKEKPNGRSTEPGGPGVSGNEAPEPADGGHDAASHGVLLRTALVRDVRREDRKNPVTGQTRPVVVVDYIASTEDIDSHGSILVCDWDQDGRLKRYLDNPVVLWMHDRTMATPPPAIGTAENVRVDAKELLLTVVCDDTTDLDRAIAEKLIKRVLRGGSVGWAPGVCEIREIDGEEILVFSKNELREFSIANVPSNPNTLAQGQRALVSAAREMARSRGGRVEMRDVLTQLHAPTPEPVRGAVHDVRDWDLVTVKAGVIAAGNVSQGGRGGVDIPESDISPVKAHLAKQFDMTPPREKDEKSARPSDHGATMTKKRIEIDERAVRADKGGIICDITCPECKADFDMSAKVMPMTPEKEKALETAQTRAGDAEKNLERVTVEKDAAEKRATLLDGRLASQETLIRGLREQRVTAEIEKRVGVRIDPAERDDQVRLAMLDIADVTPDPDKASSTLGEKAFAARLAKLDARRDLGLLGAPITAGGAGNTAGTTPGGQARSLLDNINATAN